MLPLKTVGPKRSGAIGRRRPAVHFQLGGTNEMSKKYLYLFSEGNGSMTDLLGGKGANLAEMTNLGMPVPHGFTISTEACRRYYEDGQTIGEDILADVFVYLKKLEELSGKTLGDPENPLLVSVRSGAKVSMPGMMDTILNLGLNDQVVEGVAKLTNNERFAYDSYRRFIQMFSDVVMELPKSDFERMLDEKKEARGVKQDTELNAQDMRELVDAFKAYYRQSLGRDFPSDPKEQLVEAIKAVFRSWDNPRAVYYRKLNDIPSSAGTAVNVQMMVFGNMGNDSGTGVAFTRNPSTGEKVLYGEYLMNAQGEDVVAGIRTPKEIHELQKSDPKVYAEFVRIADTLEKHYKNMQDMEFTIEKGKLYMLQTRNGKRTAVAALQVAVDMVKEGLITEKEALLMLDPKQLDSLLHPQFDAEALIKAKFISNGLPASPGAACGKAAFSAQEAIARAAAGEKVVLVRLETSPEDIEGMHASEGILTARGGMTSHAAVVARGMGICCVAGCGELQIDEEAGTFVLGGRTFTRDDYISLDGATGHIYGEALPTVPANITGNFDTIMKWSDKYRRLEVRTNADNPVDARQAKSFGAQGIGLCRTEHMFFGSDRIPAMRRMILSQTEDQRRKALSALLPMQQGDFEAMYEAMEGRPITIRFLDPPLHEFLPTEEEDIISLAADMDMEVQELRATVISLHEFNPMMGHRGCRLAVSYPEIAEMQTTAVIQAAINVKRRHPDWDIAPEIMVPLVDEVKELRYVKHTITETANAIIEKSDVKISYKVGTMIEIPRAALTADEIATEAEFFSFGTNDLTQMTFGFSRDDAGSFLGNYYTKKIFDSDPFAKLDQKGVGKLVKMAAEMGRATRPDLHMGICGEHGGDPSSIEFCHKVGLDYVSCSPYRVPLARLAAAQAAIKND